MIARCAADRPAGAPRDRATRLSRSHVVRSDDAARQAVLLHVCYRNAERRARRVVSLIDSTRCLATRMRMTRYGCAEQTSWAVAQSGSRNARAAGLCNFPGCDKLVHAAMTIVATIGRRTRLGILYSTMKWWKTSNHKMSIRGRVRQHRRVITNGREVA